MSQLMIDLSSARQRARVAADVEMALRTMADAHSGRSFRNGDLHVVHYRAVWSVLTEEMGIDDRDTQVISVLQGIVEDGGGHTSPCAFEDLWFAGRVVAFGIEMLTKGVWKEKLTETEEANYPKIEMAYRAIPVDEYFDRIANLESVAVQRGSPLKEEAKRIADSIRTALCAKRVAVLRRIHTWEPSLQRAYIGITRILLKILGPCAGSELLRKEFDKERERVEKSA